MATYVLVYKGGSMPATPEEQQQVIGAWTEWYTRLGDGVVDPGNPFGPSSSIANDGTVSEGGASGLSGYTILKADDLDAAVEMAKTCPVMMGGANIEVYETFSVM